ncbi:MAG: hypothetical protein E7K18_09515 [Anaerococcus vaginalis]|mgnify:CR=1 FL=1|uniref:hypothetical protein n=1 Tax=Anaerococcus vaginalis TaxID=33037 RepID=UPI0028FF184C|nr:hypothetical protein [Anaerococcus vaginalis]MDU3152674.1 hypothetical protein [Anaerococcus hydrogenalis]MDU3198778.1 hypothetical protein [Anaerococcus hydrogenalis]MDU7651185.1 hypothetical protein [Anaerococcus vaginalis]
MKKKFKFTFSLLFCFAFILILNNSKVYASSNVDTESENLPEMKLSEVIENNVKEAIITDFDVPGFPQPPIDNSYDYNSYGFMVLASKKKSSKGKWVYMYTAQPYAFYRNSKTGAIKVVQVTPTAQHVANVVTKGWADSIARGPAYLGGR